MHWHSLTKDQVLQSLRANAQTGLSAHEAQLRLRDGRNVLQAKKPKTVLQRFLSQFADFMILILLAAAAVSFVTARINHENGFTDCAVILGIVVLNAVIGTVQEARAQKALDALRKLSAPHALVLRNGRETRIDAADVVPGDVLLLAAGDRVPADARLLTAVGVTTQESALTGESMPCEKDADAVCAVDCAPADRRNMLFSSTVVLTGHAAAVVCETGMRTQIGRIAGMLDEQEAPKTPLQQKLAKVGRVLGIGALAICALIFLLGVLHKVPPLDSFMLSISLAVAAIPEGLPAIVTVVLSLGVQRMAKHGAILTRLPAVETLGAATVICSDKTGTLTQNRMTVTKVVPADARNDANDLLRYAALCSNATVTGSRRRRTVTGEPTETALVLAAQEVADLHALQNAFPRVAEQPFDSARKRMSTLHKTADGYLQITKGAPDLLAELCARVRTADGDVPMTPEKRDSLFARNRALAEQSLRVLAVACRTSQTESIEERELTFLGFVGMTDPPRPETAAAVAQCRQAGITPVMITGDHAVTAKAVAVRIGICTEDDPVLSGADLARMDDATLAGQVRSCRVFARVTPEHKVRIVHALRAQGEVVAMTGDGVNDAPALKSADIGCAMGESGTDVAKGAADMILTDDNFATIVRAVAEGRGIYDNIRKAVHFLLSSNVGEILVVFASSVLRLPAPLLPIQLLWVNLVTDSLPALALGTEPQEEDVMRRPPVPAADSFFAGGLGFDIAVEGMLIGAITLLAFIEGNHLGGADVGRTMAFTTLSMGEIGYAVSMRSSENVWKAGLLRNKKMVWAVLTCTLLQGSVLTIPTLSKLFQTTPLGLRGLLWTLLFSALPFAVLELEKRLRRDRSGRRFYGFVGRLPARRLRKRLQFGLRDRRSRRLVHGRGR